MMAARRLTVKDILNLDSGVYAATMDGVGEIQIRRQKKGYGYDILYPRRKNGWRDVRMYGESGEYYGCTTER